MRFFGIFDITDFGNQENLALSLLHLQPAFGLLIVSFWHTQLVVEGFLFRADCLPVACYSLSGRSNCVAARLDCRTCGACCQE